MSSVSRVSSSTSSNRITGTNSGLDIDSLVTVGVQNDQNKIDKANKETQILEWQQEQYRDIISEAQKFYNNYLDIASEDSLLRSSNYQTTKFTSNSSAVTATSTDNAEVANYTVDVQKLATAATVTLDVSSMTAGNKITVNGKEITLAGSSGSEIAKKLNAELSSVGAKVSYSSYADNGAGGFILSSTTLGFNSSIIVNGSKTENGEDAKVNIKKDGEGGITYTGSSNTTTIDGVTFKFNAITEKDTPAKIKGTTDASGLVDKISSFINDYNNLLGKINDRINESYDSSYTPLTDAQKKAMSETEIEKWEKKAQTGLLRKDDLLTSLANNMKNVMSTFVKGVNLDLDSIGITQQGDDYLTASVNGLLEVDKTKLKEAIEKDPAAIKELFLGTNSNGILNSLSDQLKTNAINTSSALAQKAGIDKTSTSINNTISKSIIEKKKRITELTTLMEEKKQTLYSKYASLETALEKLYSQQSYLTSAFSS